MWMRVKKRVEAERKSVFVSRLDSHFSVHFTLQHSASEKSHAQKGNSPAEARLGKGSQRDAEPAYLYLMQKRIDSNSRRVSHIQTPSKARNL